MEAHGDVEGFLASVHDNDFPLEAISSLIEKNDRKKSIVEVEQIIEIEQAVADWSLK